MVIFFEGEKSQTGSLQRQFPPFPSPAVCADPLPRMVGAEQWSSSLSREEQLRLHFQVPGKCPATHRDLMVPSLPPDLLQTSTDPNFLWPSTDLGLGFSRDHGSKEFSWPQTSLLQQGLIQQRGRGWELGISQGRAARNGHKRANSYSLVTQAEPTELL